MFNNLCFIFLLIKKLKTRNMDRKNVKPMINSPSLNPNRYTPVKDLEKPSRKLVKLKQLFLNILNYLFSLSISAFINLLNLYIE